MSASISLLKSLSDTPQDFEVSQSIVVMRHHGDDLVLELQNAVGIGDAVLEKNGAHAELVPVSRYVQERILRLPKLAVQIRRELERVARLRPAPYVDGPAEVLSGSGAVQRLDTQQAFLEYVEKADVGSTRLILLMADAGQGKTVLIENAALEASASYVPDSHPRPLILPVDLLGRYVGTIDDAIAGSLNNTYSFPGLTQKDVTVAIKNGWLILALDGFDELVARIGARDSIIRINELIDQLDCSGTIVLSARKSFFEMQEVSTALRAYLKPKTGAYSTPTIRLAPWGVLQAEQILSKLGSSNPKKDAAEVLGLFTEDSALMSEPFFLTRVAKLWLDGGVFSVPGGNDRFAQAEYLIGEFTKRETEEKWSDKNAEQLLTIDQHALLLGAIAEEMWVSAAFRLTSEELSIAADIGLDSCALTADVMDQVKSRVSTHGALSTSGRYTQFRHQRFFNYFFARRVAKLLVGKDEKISDLAQTISGPDLGPEILDWVQWFAGKSISGASLKSAYLIGLARTGVTDNVRNNAAGLLCILINDINSDELIEGITFVGDALRAKRISACTFENCRFWHVDLSDAVLLGCSFNGCEFGDILLNENSSFAQSKFNDVVVQSIQSDRDSLPLYTPDEIGALLAERGAFSVNQGSPPPKMLISSEVIRTVEKLVRKSLKLWDMAREDFEEDTGEFGGFVIKFGLQAGVLKEISKATSGPKKHFVRLQVDRDELVSGWKSKSKNLAVATFWDLLREKYGE